MGQKKKKSSGGRKTKPVKPAPVKPSGSAGESAPPEGITLEFVKDLIDKGDVDLNKAVYKTTSNEASGNGLPLLVTLKNCLLLIFGCKLRSSEL